MDEIISSILKELSDEEKKALERIDYIQDFIIENGQYNADVNDMEYFSRIKNLIEKQSKEIEELKKNADLTTVYLNGFYDGEKKGKDKIKAKIEEYDDKEMTVNLVNRIAGKTFQQAVRNDVRKVLQSLSNEEE